MLKNFNNFVINLLKQKDEHFIVVPILHDRCLVLFYKNNIFIIYMCNIITCFN